MQNKWKSISTVVVSLPLYRPEVVKEITYLQNTNEI